MDTIYWALSVYQLHAKGCVTSSDPPEELPQG